LPFEPDFARGGANQPRLDFATLARWSILASALRSLTIVQIIEVRAHCQCNAPFPGNQIFEAPRFVENSWF
jgi:hypothetical protein